MMYSEKKKTKITILVKILPLCLANSFRDDEF